MKIDNKIVKNYAYSLYQLACEKKNQIKILQDLQLFHRILQQNNNLLEAMTSPLMVVETKLRIIQAINQKAKLAELVVNFLSILAKNNRIMWLEVVICAFETYYKTSQNISTAHIESANQLTQSEQKIIKDYLEKQFGTEFDLKTKVNHKLIGGVKINYDSILIDLSVLGALEKINKKLQQA